MSTVAAYPAPPRRHDTSWVAETRERIRFVQDQLVRIGAWAKDTGATEATTESLLRPYRGMLDGLYERDLPVADLVDRSDLLLHVAGPAVSGHLPKVSLVTKLMSEARDEVTRLAKALAGIEEERVPASLDMSLVGLAPGSLYLGFSVASDDAAGSTPGDHTREAVRRIGEMSKLLTDGASIDVVAEAMSDPAERDLAMTAVRRLAPSGKVGIREVRVLGRCITSPVSLDVVTRRQAKALLSQPGRHEPAILTFVGTVRELDLDESRFELRNIEGGVRSVRCAHELTEAEAQALMNQKVRVRGMAELGTNREPRLLWVDELEVVTG